jgi:hypothetical protein
MLGSSGQNGGIISVASTAKGNRRVAESEIGFAALLAFYIFVEG